jgi:hypothetical protein
VAAERLETASSRVTSLRLTEFFITTFLFLVLNVASAPVLRSSTAEGGPVRGGLPASPETVARRRNGLAFL